MTLIGQIKSKDKDGYKLLWRFLHLYVPIINPVPPNNAPTFLEHRDIQALSWAFERYYRLMKMSGTITSEVVMSRTFLMAITDTCYAPQRIIFLQQLDPYNNLNNPLANFSDLPDTLTISGLAESIQNDVLGMQYDPTNTTVSDLNRRINHIESLQHYSIPPHVAALTGSSSMPSAPSVSHIQGSSGPCKATQNHLVYGNNMLMLS